ncbi:uncharacterized protein [Antedon mediterranea]|uniref:uncharacterized protein isoform X1 n=1 Tax=Antedon mediterranea TaxID=105859 RepID=UPI003AF7F997
MGSSPSKAVTIEQVSKQESNKNSTMTSSAVDRPNRFEAPTRYGNTETITPKNATKPATVDYDDWDDGSEMTKLTDELDELLGIPLDVKTNARVPEPLGYQGGNIPIRPKKQELGKGNAWKMPDELLERELNARQKRILDKMKALMIACEEEDVDVSPWIHSMANEEEEDVQQNTSQLEDTSRFDTRKFKEANVYKKVDNNSSSISVNRLSSHKSLEQSSSAIQEKPTSRLPYNSSEEALMSSIENQYTSK